jgi:HTH-type transcriptional regulator, bacterioopsin transcriptional activator and related proteins
MLRKSPLFQFKHGDHVCVFYRSEKTLMEVLTPHIAEGLRRGERCFCVQKAEVIRRLFADLRFLGLDPEHEIKRGALRFHTEEEIYYPHGQFEPERMMELLMQSIQQAVKDGFLGFRTAGELSWAARGDKNCNQVIGYEHMVQECFPGRPAIGLCQYHLNVFSRETLNSVLAAHKLHLVEENDHHSSYSSLSLGCGPHSAEIVADRIVANPNFYYVVQQHRPKEVIGWGVAPDFVTANREVERLMKQSATVH